MPITTKNTNGWEYHLKPGTVLTVIPPHSSEYSKFIIKNICFYGEDLAYEILSLSVEGKKDLHSFVSPSTIKSYCACPEKIIKVKGEFYK